MKDSERCDGLQVIGAGHGRTGTTSLKLALEQIYGGRCHHMTDVAGRSHECRFWLEACQGKKSAEDYKNYFQKFKCAVDAPSAFLWEDLLEAFPDAKVILTVRDPDKWFDSAAKTILNMYHNSRYVGIRILMATINRTFAKMQIAYTNLWARDPDFVHSGGCRDRERCKKLLVEWDESVKDRCPPNKLLVFQVKDGWAPLCEFLGKPVPTCPFPHENDTKAFRRVIHAFNALGIIIGVTLLPVAVIATVIFPIRPVELKMRKAPREAGGLSVK